MHCPSCGNLATSEQQFCRSCGMNLQPVGELVAAHSHFPSNENRISKAEAEREIAGRMFSWIGWGALVLGIGVMLLVANRHFDLGKWFSLVGPFVILSGAGIAMFGLFKTMREGAHLSGSSEAKTITPAGPSKYLPEERIPIQPTSVTERTTQLIAEREIPPQDVKEESDGD